VSKPLLLHLSLHARRALALGVVVACVGVAATVVWRYGALHSGAKTDNSDAEIAGPNRRKGNIYIPTAAQWASLDTEPVKERVFRSEQVTEGKISVNEDQATPVFPPYAGRVTRLLAKPGDYVERGQALFYIEANDMVQAQNDFLTAIAGLNKARAKLNVSEIIEKQNHKLYDVKAGPLRDWQTSQADLAQAKSDLQAAEVVLEAMRNRLRILGKSDAEIDVFQQKGLISPETPIYAPLSGTVVARKIGPGQYVSYTSTGAVDPVFVIGDLSSVWLVAYVREADAGKVRIGQPIDFTVLAHPDRPYRANINYVASILDANIRRLLVRATIPNGDRVLKPEMYAKVRIIVDEGDTYAAVPRQSIIYEGETARVWVARNDKSVELRQLKLGVADGKFVQVLDGVRGGETVITKGNLFIDRAATGS
jgi:cobalt-zinc-cadmium efflux system membrane fusion protein